MVDVLANERAEERADQLKRRKEYDLKGKLKIWPGVCETCYANPGVPCFTRTGGRAIRHWSRR